MENILSSKQRAICLVSNKKCVCFVVDHDKHYTTLTYKKQVIQTCQCTG